MHIAVTFVALLLAACSAGGSPKIAATDGWTREVAPGQTSAAAYVTISNQGDGADSLIAAESSVAAKATLHSSSSAGGIARMRPIEGGLEIPPHATVAFKPGGNHIMLTGLQQPLKAGQAVDLSLQFEKSGRQAIALRVLPATSEDSHMHGMAM